MKYSNVMSMRADMSVEFTKSDSVVDRVANQTAYDAASVIDRQIRILGLTKEDYLSEAEKQRSNSKIYDAMRTHGMNLKSKG